MPFLRRSGAVAGALLCAGVVACAQAASRPAAAAPSLSPVPATARQLVVVVTPGWNATTGTLRRYSRDDPAQRWHAAAPSIPVVLGRTGLAVRVAEETGITLAGFARDGRVTIYSHPERVDA